MPASLAHRRPRRPDARPRRRAAADLRRAPCPPILLAMLLALLASPLAVSAAVPTGAASGKPSDVASAPAFEPTIPLEEIAKGQTGYGYSVFAGSEPERFEAEVIGVMRNTSPGTSYILARLTGHGLEETGVAAGMSGSPVWIDGRLAGAVAFAWPFSKQAIAGITPIGAMRGLAAGAAAGTAPASAAFTGSGPPVALDRLAAADLPDDLLERELSRLRPRMAGGAVPGVEWSLVGFGEATEGLLRRSLGAVAPAGEAVATPGDAAAPTLVRGGAVAAVLVDGDLRLAATGTVTDVLDDRVLAFGHPFLGLGPISVPMASAEVVTILPSDYSSFKIANIGPVVGAFREDRQAGILGRLGESAPTIPLTVRIDGEGGREFHMRLAEIPQMTPVLVAISTLAGLDSATHAGGLQGLDLAATIHLAGYPDVEVRQSFDGDGAAVSSAIYLLGFVGYLLQNELADLAIEGIEVDLSQTGKPRTAALVGAHAERTVVRPGDPVRLNLDFTAWRGDTFRRTVEVKVPDDAPDGSYYLFVGGGPSVDAARLAVERTSPVNIRQALAMMRSFHSRSDLLVMGVAAGAGLSVAGEVMPNLPGSVRSLWSAASSGSATPLRLAVVQQHVEPLGVPVDGLVRIDLKVERHEPLTRETAAGERGEAEGQDGSEADAVGTETAGGPAADEGNAAAAATGDGPTAR